MREPASHREEGSIPSSHKILIEKEERLTILNSGFVECDSHLYDVCSIRLQIERMKAPLRFKGKI